VLLRTAVSAALMMGVMWWVDASAVIERFVDWSPVWLLLALAISGLQVVLSAWRWCFTAARLGLELPLTTAVAEYYLATFLNQVLPGGVVGDAGRAWRHARRADATGPAVHAVIIERASGQLAMVLVAGLALFQLPQLFAHVPPVAVFAALALALLVLGLLFASRARALARFRHDLIRGLLVPSVLPLQLVTSLTVVATYVAVGVFAARAIGIDTGVVPLLGLMPLMLLAMLVPFSVSGWGFREAAAALLWPLAGLPAADGVAIAVAYGLVIFAASLPGAVVLAWRPTVR
jgi:glycosyltransferase 2 family protein